MTAAQARLRQEIAAAELDALIVVGDDQEELFDAANTPAIGIYFGDTLRNAAGKPADDPMGRARARFLAGC